MSHRTGRCLIMNQSGIYILQSLKNGRYYIGSTNDIERRLKEHNAGEVRATRYLMPLKLCLFYLTKSLTEARQIEYKLKKFKSRKIVEKIIIDQKINLGV